MTPARGLEPAARSESDLPDYIRETNRLSDELLRSHTELLARKNIHRKLELFRVIRLDLDKLTHALTELRVNCAQDVLQKFFGDAADCDAIGRRLTGSQIGHVGFEIHEPLSLVLHGLRHWIEQSKRLLGADMQIRDYLRFPASSAFQKRVAAPAEIMRLWLDVEGQVLMLELFDIYRPIDPVLANSPKPTHRNFHGLFRPEGSAAAHRQRLSRLFADDEIWHYAFHVAQPEDVRELHAELRRLAEVHSGYFLPYAEPVHNEHDRSFHTKIVRHGSVRQGSARLELEFVTQYR